MAQTPEITGVQTVVGMARFNLARLDTEMYARSPTPKMTPILQVSMPVQGFIAMTLMFQQQIQEIVKAGIMTQDQLDAFRDQVIPKTQP